MTKIIKIEGGRIKNNPYDFYDTPKQFIDASLKLLPDSFVPGKILDPGAGRGAWGNSARLRWLNSEIDGVEYNPEMTRHSAYTHWFNDDFRKWEVENAFDLAVGNPPYTISKGQTDKTLAEKFIRTSLKAVRPGGFVLLLLKTAYLEAIGRGEGLFAEYPPMVIYQSIRRIPFRPDKGNKTNTYAYAMFLWKKDHTPTDTVIRWFDWKGGELKYMRDYPPIG